MASLYFDWNSGKNAFLSPSQLLSPSHRDTWLKHSGPVVMVHISCQCISSHQSGVMSGRGRGWVGYLPSFKCFWLLYSRPCRYCVHAHITIHNYLCLLASCACNFCTRITYMHLYSNSKAHICPYIVVLHYTLVNLYFIYCYPPKFTYLFSYIRTHIQSIGVHARVRVHFYFSTNLHAHPY